MIFDRWINSCEAFDYQQLKNLMLLVQFRLSVPKEIEVYLNEREASTARHAAELADSYEVAHGGSSVTGGRRRGFEDRQEERSPRQSEGGNWRPPMAGRYSSPRPPQPRGPVQMPNRNQVSSGEFRCFWCHKVGHKKSQCPSLASRRTVAKPVGLVSVEQKPEDELEGYEGFISQGSLSDSRDGLSVPVTSLRDTGAKQTLLRKGVVELPHSSFTGQFTAVQGVSGDYEFLPLYQLYLRSELVTGLVLVAEAPNLPFQTIDLVMANDVAGVKFLQCVWSPMHRLNSVLRRLKQRRRL